MVRPSRADWAARAMPKSATFTFPVWVSRTLAGFMSRWTMPCWWAAASPAAISAPISMTLAGASGASPRTMSRSVGPSTYSMTMKYAPSSWPKS